MQERVLDSYIHRRVSVDDMHFGLCLVKVPLMQFFIVRQLQQKFITAKKHLFFDFVDLEKAFGRVPSKVLWWALRSLAVEECVVRVFQGMYTNAQGCERVIGHYSEELNVGVSGYQGSVHCFYFRFFRNFSGKFRSGVSWKLLYADDLVVIVDSLKECVS